MAPRFGNGPPSYDRSFTPDDIRAVKKLIRSLSGVPHRLTKLLRRDNDEVLALTKDGSGIGGAHILLKHVGEEWQVISVSHTIA